MIRTQPKPGEAWPVGARQRADTPHQSVSEFVRGVVQDRLARTITDAVLVIAGDRDELASLDQQARL